MGHVLSAILFPHDLEAVVRRAISVYPWGQRLDPALPYHGIDIQGIEGSA
jgi:hypothetical protein